MGKPRKKKLQERKAKQERATQRKFEITERILKMFGLYSAIGPYAQRYRNEIVSQLWPRLEVVLEGPCAQDPLFEEIRARVEDAAVTPIPVQLGDEEVEIAYADILRGFDVVSGFLEYLYRHSIDPRSIITEEEKNRVAEAVNRARVFRERWLKVVLNEMIAHLDELVDDYFFLDKQVVWYRIEPVHLVWGPGPHRIVVGQTLQRPFRLQVRGESRHVFRCEVTHPFLGVRTLTWNPRELGLGPSQDPIPVFVSRHAIERLEERMYLGNCWSLSHRIVRDSLLRPRFVPRGRREDRLLVEVGPPAEKFGYLSVLVTNEFALVKTFLFLTMRGTPESRMLHEKARLTSTDITSLKLDHLKTFAESDIGEDPALRNLLVDCNLGHLLVFLNPCQRIPYLKDYGSRLRKLVGVPAAPPIDGTDPGGWLTQEDRSSRSA